MVKCGIKLILRVCLIHKLNVTFNVRFNLWTEVCYVIHLLNIKSMFIS